MKIFYAALFALLLVATPVMAAQAPMVKADIFGDIGNFFGSVIQTVVNTASTIYNTLVAGPANIVTNLASGRGFSTAPNGFGYATTGSGGLFNTNPYRSTGIPGGVGSLNNPPTGSIPTSSDGFRAGGITTYSDPNSQNYIDWNRRYIQQQAVDEITDVQLQSVIVDGPRYISSWNKVTLVMFNAGNRNGDIRLDMSIDCNEDYLKAGIFGSTTVQVLVPAGKFANSSFYFFVPNDVRALAGGKCTTKFVAHDAFWKSTSVIILGQVISTSGIDSADHTREEVIIIEKVDPALGVGASLGGIQ